MFGFMGIVFPSVIGLFMLERFFNNHRLGIKNYIYYFVILCLFSNIMCLVISKLFFNISSYISMSLNSYPIYFVKYVLISLLFNFIFVVIISCVKKYIKITIEVEKRNDN